MSNIHEHDEWCGMHLWSAELGKRGKRGAILHDLDFVYMGKDNILSVNGQA